ncbi:LOW QUALITY PROTEIN: hypothetical protein KIPB_002868 [Kipferlia bialata]|uniref:Pyridine nucleotide-disulphide oxidoreductase dimerisation domain-containing protein n=1 Tax=Kipferlia bialata TaxID=797122 RepID=A0A9K3GFC9_9EUKA|nr:LOW QUALITY PROTEIN: hypothetical protein KIPB_002868 [Kipferlia bialata]
MTNVEGVYAVGDINGKALFRHAANYQQASVMAQFASVASGVSWKTVHTFGEALGLDRQLDPCPSAIFTHPTIAYLGMRESDLTSPYVKSVLWFKNHDRGIAIMPKTGFVKVLVCAESGRLLGIHCLGTDADVLVHSLTPYLWAKTPVEEILTSGTTVHPTLSEVCRNVLFDARKQLLDLGRAMDPLARYMA